MDFFELRKCPEDVKQRWCMVYCMVLVGQSSPDEIVVNAAVKKSMAISTAVGRGSARSFDGKDISMEAWKENVPNQTPHIVLQKRVPSIVCLEVPPLSSLTPHKRTLNVVHVKRFLREKGAVDGECSRTIQ